MRNRNARICLKCSGLKFELFRCKIEKSKSWRFICSSCLIKIKAEDSYYQYGGTWKAKKKA